MENDDADDVGEDAARHNRSAAARMETDDADDAGEHDRWMQRALDLADAAVRKGEVPVGAVFVVDGCVETKFRAPTGIDGVCSMAWSFQAVDATSSPRSRRLDGVEVNLTHRSMSTQVDGVEVARGANATNAAMDATRHAELVAVDAALAARRAVDWRNATLYVTCEPCIMCAAALAQLGLRRCFFGCSNEK
jgi:tRNA(Arg) A34 adenosine deaminase TadA